MKTCYRIIALCSAVFIINSCKKEQALLKSVDTAPEINLSVNAVAPLTVTTIAGKSGQEEGYKDGTGPEALFTSPLGIGLANDGSLFIADTRTNKIRQVTQAGVVSTFNIPNSVNGTPLRTPYSVKQKSDGTIVIYAYEFENKYKNRVWTYKPGSQPTEFVMSDKNNTMYAGISPDPYYDQYWTGGMMTTSTGAFRGFIQRILPSGKVAETYYIPLDKLDPDDRNFPIVHKIFAGYNGVKYLLINDKRFYKYTASGISRIWPNISFLGCDDIISNKDSKTFYVAAGGKIYSIINATGKLTYLVGPHKELNGGDGVGVGADVFAHNLALSKDENTLYFTDIESPRTIRKLALK